jgi:ubiquitin-like 1-activating enzyme E1 B
MAELQKEAAALKEIRASMGSTEFPQKVFAKVFTQDINRLLGMEDMWKTRKPPTALDFEAVNTAAANVDRETISDDQKNWSLEENFAVFSDSLIRLSDRLDKLRASQETGNAPPILTFDKDDRDTLDFVAAAANLRSITFGIETKSEFDIKQMAGNIIPAIATTNATTAALCVLEAFKIMRGDWAKAKMVFLTKSTERIINKEHLRPPRPDCGVCATAYARLVINTDKTTLEALVKEVLVAKLGYKEDELEVSNDGGVWYDPDMAMDDNDNLEKTLNDIGIVNNSTVVIRGEDDEGERVNLELSISNMYVPDPFSTTDFTKTDSLPGSSINLQPPRPSPSP